MKRIITIVLAALIVWSCGNKTQFTLNGTIVPAIDGNMIRYEFVQGSPVPADTAEIVNGKFMFSGSIDIAQINFLVIEGENNPVAHLFIEPGKIKMTLYPDSFESNVITGSKSNDVFRIYMDEIISFSSKERELHNRFRSAQMTGNEEEMDAVRFEYETIIDNTRLYAKNFIKQHPKSPVSAYVYLMNFFEEAEVAELDSMLVVFEPIKASDLVAVIQERADLLRVTGIGAIAPDFTLEHLAETPISLSSLRGKYVLIDFWASWCQPCMVELPNVIEQYKAFKDKGFEIYGVSLDRNGDAWLNTIRDYKMDWINGWDMQGEIATMYGVSGIPHMVLIDTEGKIIAKNLRGPALQEKLDELLN